MTLSQQRSPSRKVSSKLKIHIQICKQYSWGHERLTQEEVCVFQTDNGGKLTFTPTDGLSFFTKTDPGWGDFMRINPLLEWTYEDVWGCMLALEIPYCCLYDKGYTSLGLTTNTFPNPALRLDGTDTYAPAHSLKGSGERHGRREEHKGK